MIEAIFWSLVGMGAGLLFWVIREEYRLRLALRDWDAIRHDVSVAESLPANLSDGALARMSNSQFYRIIRLARIDHERATKSKAGTK